LTKV